MTPKLLSPENLRRILLVMGERSLDDEADAIRAHIAALDADNAARQRTAMVRAAAELRHTYGNHANGYRLDPELVARAIRLLEEATNDNHPGAVLLSEHAKVLVRARNEARDQAIAAIDEAFTRDLDVSAQDVIRAMKETEE